MKTVKLIVVGMLMSFSVCAQDANNKAGNVDWVARFEAMVDTMNAKVSTATSDQWVHYKKQYNLLVAEYDIADKAHLTQSDVRKINMYKDSCKKLQINRKTKRVSNGLKKGTAKAKGSVKDLVN
jgi:hypothetical protein